MLVEKHGIWFRRNQINSNSETLFSPLVQSALLCTVPQKLGTLVHWPGSTCSRLSFPFMFSFQSPKNQQAAKHQGEPTWSQRKRKEGVGEVKAQHALTHATTTRTTWAQIGRTKVGAHMHAPDAWPTTSSWTTGDRREQRQIPSLICSLRKIQTTHTSAELLRINLSGVSNSNMTIPDRVAVVRSCRHAWNKELRT